MSTISFIAKKELKSNKKMAIIMIFSIIIVTILINSITTLALSYQKYIIELSRNKENWEANFSGIQYDNIKYIEDDKNVKEISIIQDIGISENSYSELHTELIHIKAYDINALKNLSINLKEGRLPQTENEIIINHNMNFAIGDSINTTIKGKELTYKIVGKLENTEFDEFNYTNLMITHGAITLCVRENIKSAEFVEASIICNDISNIYNTTKKIENIINSYNPNMNISYNEELLSYAFVAKDGSNFQTSIIIAVRFTYRYNSCIIYCFNIYNI